MGGRIQYPDLDLHNTKLTLAPSVMPLMAMAFQLFTTNQKKKSIFAPLAQNQSCWYRVGRDLFRRVWNPLQHLIDNAVNILVINVLINSSVVRFVAGWLAKAPPRLMYSVMYEQGC